MIIKVEKYVLSQSTNSNGFDLSEVVEKTKKETGEKYAGEKPIGYDMRLETCVETIVMNNLKEKEDVVGLNEFIEVFKEEKQKISNLLK